MRIRFGSNSHSICKQCARQLVEICKCTNAIVTELIASQRCRLLLQHFQWRHVAVIVHETSEMLELIHRALVDALDEADEMTYDTFALHRPLAKVNMTHLLLDAAKDARSE